MSTSGLLLIVFISMKERWKTRFCVIGLELSLRLFNQNITLIELATQKNTREGKHVKVFFLNSFKWHSETNSLKSSYITDGFLCILKTNMNTFHYDYQLMTNDHKLAFWLSGSRMLVTVFLVFFFFFSSSFSSSSPSRIFSSSSSYRRMTPKCQLIR